MPEGWDGGFVNEKPAWGLALTDASRTRGSRVGRTLLTASPSCFVIYISIWIILLPRPADGRRHNAIVDLFIPDWEGTQVGKSIFFTLA